MTRYHTPQWGKTREIKNRMKAVANIRRITKTMQMIATAKFQASQRRATEAQAYTRKIAELVGELSAAGGAVEHALLKAPAQPVSKRLVLVITSNRGLCGGYNANVLRTAMSKMREHTGQRVDLEVVGKKAMAYFKFAGVHTSSFHSHFTDKPEYDEVERLADRYIKAFTQGEYDAVEVVYMAFHSAGRQSPEALTLLPLQRVPGQEKAGSEETSGSGASGGAIYDFSPQPDELLNELLPITVKTQLFQCFNEAAVSEHIARMVAMKAATDSAGKMGKDLTRQYNRARQAAITTELSEIIAGSAALA